MLRSDTVAGRHEIMEIHNRTPSVVSEQDGRYGLIGYGWRIQRCITRIVSRCRFRETCHALDPIDEVQDHDTTEPYL